MKIIDIRALKGPNYWSIKRHKLIVMRLDLEELEELPSNKIEDFYHRLRTLMPSPTLSCASASFPAFFQTFQSVQNRFDLLSGR